MGFSIRIGIHFISWNSVRISVLNEKQDGKMRVIYCSLPFRLINAFNEDSLTRLSNPIQNLKFVQLRNFRMIGNYLYLAIEWFIWQSIIQCACTKNACAFTIIAYREFADLKLIGLFATRVYLSFRWTERIWSKHLIVGGMWMWSRFHFQFSHRIFGRGWGRIG